MHHSDSIYKLSQALCKAQKKFKTAVKKSVNPYFKSKYADYSEILSCVKGPLNEEGISILQPVKDDVVETILLHESGEYISSSTKIFSISNKPQDYGSALTYARRYGLSSLLAIDSDEDDDGNNANGNHLNIKNQEQDLISIKQKILNLYKKNITKEQLEEVIGYPLTEIQNHATKEILNKLIEFEKTLIK